MVLFSIFHFVEVVPLIAPPLPLKSPVRGGQIFLLLEAFLQAHQLQLGEHRAAPAPLLALVPSIAPVF